MPARDEGLGGQLLPYQGAALEAHGLSFVLFRLL